jgi:hypothetical protein
MTYEPTESAITAERYVTALRAELTEPRDKECLACYVSRMLEEFGCDNQLRWVRRWRDACAPRATALERRMEGKGGFCDCEVAYNVYPEQMLYDDAADLPPCLGVSRRGSTSPCRDDTGG